MEKGGIFGVGRLPPGFRFFPTDEELIVQYLRKKVFSYPLPASVIPDVELSRFDPWDLPGGGVAVGGSEKDRYFFNLRESKYRNGSRTNRAAGTGYWKATGRDRQIMSSQGDQVVGVKKFLVFYRGKPPHGSRTDWVMHEYYLAGASKDHILPPKKNTTTYRESWVLCHIFQKKRADKHEDSETNVEPTNAEPINGRIPFIDFFGRRNSDTISPALASESSCVTELPSELNSEDGSCNSPTSPLFPCRWKP